MLHIHAFAHMDHIVIMVVAFEPYTSDMVMTIPVSWQQLSVKLYNHYQCHNKQIKRVLLLILEMFFLRIGHFPFFATMIITMSFSYTLVTVSVGFALS